MSAIFDKLEELRSYGCRCFSFIMLREPLHQAISDFRYFPKSYPEFEGNVTEFLRGMVSGEESGKWGGEAA